MKKWLKWVLLSATALYGAYLVGHFFGPVSVAPSKSVGNSKGTDLAFVALPAPRELVERSSVEKVKTPEVKKPEVKKPVELVGGSGEFRELLTRAWARLPRLRELKKKGVDFHHAPSELLSFGEELGQIGDALEQDPSLTEAGIDFLKRCAEASEVMTSARAVCLRDLKHYSRTTLVDLSRIPESVKRLADRLPTTP